MSRWDDEFRNHPFQAYWQALKSEVPKLTVDDMTIATNTQEVARLRKVIAYLDTVVEAVDPELVPPSTWSNFVGQAEGCLQQVRAYISNRDIGHINNANANADNLLSYVKPYMVAPSDAAKAANAALLAYQQQVESHLKAVSAMAANIGDVSRAELDSLKESARFARDKADEIRALRVLLLEGTGEQPSAAAEIESLRSRAQAAESEIQSYQRRLFVESDQPSIKSAVDQVVNAINRDVETIQKTLLLNQGKVNELDVFYTQIFGELDATGNPISGLKLELDQRTKQLGLFESTQSEKYNAMYTRIETLLPGATSAGLATAYRALTRSFSAKIKTNTSFFMLRFSQFQLLQYYSLLRTLRYGHCQFLSRRSRPTTSYSDSLLLKFHS
jgi:predicted  nucleic acid-binding Zn-ribbon protein